jgi:hypothetical protein
MLNSPLDVDPDYYHGAAGSVVNALVTVKNPNTLSRCF